MAAVRLAGICKYFGTTPVLQDINLTISDREFMVLVGPSGCGKSTLLRLIAGLEQPSQGQIYLDQRQIDPLPPKQRDVAMVFQNYALYPHLNVFDNIAFGLRRQQPQATKSAIAQRVKEVAQTLQIEPLLYRKPAQLSGGQKQRVALGRAIARSPQVFLMDEPLSNLDAKLRSETRSQIVQLQRELATTTIYVTHDQTEAMTMGHRIALLKDGKIQQVDSPLKLYHQPANRFVAELIGSPPMNFLPVTLAPDQQLQSPHLRQPLTVNTSAPIGTPLDLGIRPESLTLVHDSDQADLTGTVSLIETLGSETLIQIQLSRPSQTLIARSFSSNCPLQIGDQTHWQISGQVYLFEADAGTRIYPST
ncbi:MAG: ABC transporter ATP-binding protein [Pseudanabaenaceae cyanobacterium bins.68]|nr:ABC transporter ATP-binding protein [Pseudanabaenaceae cyanobacterium bins.68]